VALRLIKREKFIPIGIASSVAKASGFDWMKTIEIANKLNVSVIQLHLNQFKPEFNWQLNLAERFKQIYIHLPADFNYKHPFVASLKNIPNSPLLIQHERYLNRDDIDFFIASRLPLGFENDQQNYLYGYFDQLKKLHYLGLNIAAVIDLPRFYHQFIGKQDEKEIYNHILNVLTWCKSLQISVIMHTIDIADYQPKQASWTPIFEGILPWKEVLTFSIKESIPVKSIIFEYEDFPNMEKSICLLREWFEKREYIQYS